MRNMKLLYYTYIYILDYMYVHSVYKQLHINKDLDICKQK